MKRLFLFLLLLSAAGTLSAQSDKPRNWMQLNFLSNGEKYDKSQARIFKIKELPHWKEMSLKTFPEKKLNTIELNLLDKYADVVVTKMTKGYFLLDEDDNVGIATIEGEELIPPVKGEIKIIGNIAFFGEQTSDFDNWLRSDLPTLNQSYKVAYSFGLCKSIIKFSPSAKGLIEIIPYGKYDFCSIIPKGHITSFAGIYVCKINDDNEFLWGVCDKNGDEILPCMYKSIYYNGASFIGDNTRTMQEQELRYHRDAAIRKEIQEQRRQMWAEALNAAGQSMIEVGSSMQQLQGGDSNGSAGISAGGSSKASARGGTHPGMSRSELQQRYNSEIQNIRRLRDSWVEQIGMHGEAVNQNTLRDCKANIQSIKNSAAEHGITLQTDPLENWTPTK